MSDEKIARRGLAMTIVTPSGTFPSSAAAGVAYGITQPAAAWRARKRVKGWYYLGAQDVAVVCHAKIQAERDVVPITARRKYAHHRHNASLRGIAFLLTIEEWWSWWQEDGRWERRGNSRDGIVMSRREDTGPYSLENVRPMTMTENKEEAWKLAHEWRRSRSSRRGCPVRSPGGVFNSASQAARFHGISPGRASLLARRGLNGWSYI